MRGVSSRAMLTVVICSIDREKFRRVVEMYARVLHGVEHEIVGVHDARSMCEGYARAMSRARGERVLFSHDDVELLGGNVGARVARGFEAFDVWGVAGATRVAGAGWVRAGPPHIYGQIAHRAGNEGVYTVCVYSAPSRRVGGMRVLDGVLLGATREAVERVGFDGSTFGGFHLYDVDFSFRAHLEGLRVGVVCDLGVVHFSGGSFDARWEEDAARFESKHAGRLERPAQGRFQFSAVRVGSAEEALGVMTPEHWGAE